MDSDSGDVSSGNESDNNGPQSPTSSRSHSRGSNVRSVESRSRSSSPSQSVKRDSPQNSPQNQQTSVRSPPQSPQSPIGSRRSSDAQSELSGSSSSDENSPYYSSKNRRTSKSPGSNSYQSSERHSPVHSPVSHKSNKSDRSSRSVSPVHNNERVIASCSPRNSSRSSFTESVRIHANKSSTPENDKGSVKSISSHISKKSRSSRDSRGSRRSSSSRESRRSSEKSDNENSDSSKSVDSSSRKNKNISKVTDTQPEEILDDKGSIKSNSSYIYKKSRSSRDSRGSRRSSSSRGSRRSSEKSDNENSDSSKSVDSSSRKNKNISKVTDTQPEEISDGDMESDNEKNENNVQKEDVSRAEINISHEDLSDVSDLEESIGNISDDNHSSHKEEDKNDTKVNENENKSPEPKLVTERSCRPEEGEEQLDFEAEDGECGEINQGKEVEVIELDKAASKENEKIHEKSKERDELEEGEVTDEDDVRPEETEPRPVCRFFSRGQCTWGASCRFLHPGVTDKGNYTMFELIRPVVPGEFSRDERLFGKIEPPLVESAWERGLRTAKEMLRKSVKRKEQDIDFEEKKMNLSLAQEEFDKENGYYGRVPSPEPRYVRHVPVEYPVARPPSEEYYGRRQVLYEPEYVPPPRERLRSYRELPTHRMPDYYNNKYEEEPQSSTKRNRPKREVIVQRVEERQGRGDEWSDPWMRSKSPGRRKESGRKRSYSSGSSYSSSSSSRTTSESSRSSYRSRSRSSHRRRRSRSHRGKQLSPSVIVSERKAANERAALMNPPAPKRRAPSPGMMRVSGAANPPAPSREDPFSRNRSKLAVAAALARVKDRRRSLRSSSGSSGSSSSDSDSSDSSSSSSRDGTPPRRTGLDLSIAKAMDALKGTSSEKKQIKLNLKNPVGVRKPEPADIARKAEAVQVKKRPASSPPPGDNKSKKATSRREELLKQLKAVEDAIAKKRSKVN